MCNIVIRPRCNGMCELGENDECIIMSCNLHALMRSNDKSWLQVCLKIMICILVLPTTMF